MNATYTVRRLTPTECARLQGFPDWWADLPLLEDMTDEAFSFWQEVRATYAAINGKTYKPVSKRQMVKWYNKLHTDSAEYKMWGQRRCPARGAYPSARHGAAGRKDNGQLV